MGCNNFKIQGMEDDKGAATESISATCKIDASGSVEVTYAPANVKNTLKENAD